MLDQTQKIWHDLSRLLVQQTTTFKRIWLIPFSKLFLASDIGGPLWNLGWCHFLLQIWNKLEPQNSFKIVWIFSRFFCSGEWRRFHASRRFFPWKQKTRFFRQTPIDFRWTSLGVVPCVSSSETRHIKAGATTTGKLGGRFGSVMIALFFKSKLTVCQWVPLSPQ